MFLTVQKAIRSARKWRGRGGPSESTGRGMQEEMRWRTQEALTGSCRGDGIGMIYSY